MKKIIVANWKENKTVEEALSWLKVFAPSLAKGENLPGVIICASFPLLYPLREEIGRHNLSLRLGAQNVSLYEKGAYTGEVSVRQLAGLVDYVLLGHSERQKYFGETLEDVAAKINLCWRYHLAPFIFLRDLGDWRALEQNVPSLAETVLVYEPPAAISKAGVYRPEEPGAVVRVVSSFKAVSGLSVPVLYGGSVNEKNIEGFLAAPEIDGVVVGQASLKPDVFARLTKIAQRYGPS